MTHKKNNFLNYKKVAAWMLGLAAAWSYPFQGSTMQAVSEHPAIFFILWCSRLSWTHANPSRTWLWKSWGDL